MIELSVQQRQLIIELMNLGQKTIGLNMHPDAYRAAFEVVQMLRAQPEPPADKPTESKA